MLNNNNFGWPGKHIYRTNSDSIILQSNKDKSFIIQATNGKDTVAIYANFVNAIPNYTPDYIKNHSGKVSYEIPKTFDPF